jgi:signal transduction histidine kinase
VSGAPGADAATPAAASRPALGVLWILTAVLSLAGLVLTIMEWGHLNGGDAVVQLGAALGGVWFAALGVLIVRRARNLIGWLMLGVGFLLSLQNATSGYAIVGIVSPGTLPAPKLVGLFDEWAFVPIIALLIATFLLFPTGRLPSRRWLPVAWLGLLTTASTLAGFAVWPRIVGLPAPGGVSVTFPNPLGSRSLGPVLSSMLVGTPNGLAVASLPFFAAAVASLVVRYRRGDHETRQQIKWVAFMFAVQFAAQIAALVGQVAQSSPTSRVTTIAFAVSAVDALVGIPAVITLAILKYRLYQIDVIINRTVKYGLLSAALTAVYAAIVVGIGTLAGYVGGPLLTVAAAVVIAVLFQPVRERAQQVANRLVYGRRATPYQVLADFAQDMAGQLDAPAALERMVALLTGATGATRVEAWVRVGDELRPEVTWPGGGPVSRPVTLTHRGPDPTASPGPAVATEAGPASDPGPGGLPPLGATRAVAVRHGNELLGALTLVKPRDESLSEAEDRLLEHLASQAGLVLRNVRLTAELHATIDDLVASRQRLVRAQDEERHRIERNLHDGAQQHLVALAMMLRLLEDSAGDPGEVKEIAAQLRESVRAALEDLRSLARGIYPPLLADRGLPSALGAQAARAPLPVTIEADGVGRYRRDIEATAYFCILEALQNVSKYARASRATVTLACPDGHLEFTVTDDGAGFAPATTPRGTGLQGMEDRLAAVGGTLRITSTPGQGTTIAARLPAHQP